MDDDVSDGVKVDRLNEIIELQQNISLKKNQQLVGSTVEILVERESAKSHDEWMGRTDTNKVTVFPKGNSHIGDLVDITIDRCNSATLFGTITKELNSDEQLPHCGQLLTKRNIYESITEKL